METWVIFQEEKLVRTAGDTCTYFHVRPLHTPKIIWLLYFNSISNRFLIFLKTLSAVLFFDVFSKSRKFLFNLDIIWCQLQKKYVINVRPTHQQYQIKVVGSWCSKYTFHGHITSTHSPGAEVHNNCQFQNVYSWKIV